MFIKESRFGKKNIFGISFEITVRKRPQNSIIVKFYS